MAGEVAKQSARAGERMLEELLAGAQRRGEAGMSLARCVVCAVFLAMHVPMRAGLMAEGDPKSWILVGGLLVGLLLSFDGLRRSRSGNISIGGVYVSVAIDAFIVYLTIITGVIWPHEGYIGLLREHEPAIIYIAIVASGIRLSERGAIFGGIVHALGLVMLLVVDAALWGDILRYSYLEVVFAAAFVVVASIISYSIAYRTRHLLVEGGKAAVVAERVRHRLGIYVSEAIADDALGTADLELGGASVEAAILFSDLRGFTQYAEKLAPERLVEELNGYFQAMVAAIRAEGGHVDKYIGDAIMAVFGVPTPRGDDAARAIRAAAGMRRALVVHNAERARRGLPPFEHGIGVHYGTMVVGNIGTPERMEYTVIGDVVNVASRLESATKGESFDIYVSVDAARAAQAAEAEIPGLSEHAPLSVRGRSESLGVYTIDE